MGPSFRADVWTALEEALVRSLPTRTRAGLAFAERTRTADGGDLLGSEHAVVEGNLINLPRKTARSRVVRNVSDRGAVIVRQDRHRRTGTGG
jgi:hypothetical protein